MVYETLLSQRFLKIKHQLPIPWNLEVKGGLKKKKKQLINMVYQLLQSQQFLKIQHQLPIPWNLEVKGGLKKNEAADKYGIRDTTVSAIF